MRIRQLEALLTNPSLSVVDRRMLEIKLAKQKRQLEGIKNGHYGRESIK